jgi:CheY-like chemotaxis protein
MDCEMPVMDGFDATEQIRQTEEQLGWCSVPIVACTSHAFKDQIQVCESCGMNGHLAKPISLVSLREVIARYHREMVVA